MAIDQFGEATARRTLTGAARLLPSTDVRALTEARDG